MMWYLFQGLFLDFNVFYSNWMMLFTSTFWFWFGCGRLPQNSRYFFPHWRTIFTSTFLVLVRGWWTLRRTGACIRRRSSCACSSGESSPKGIKNYKTKLRIYDLYLWPKTFGSNLTTYVLVKYFYGSCLILHRKITLKIAFWSQQIMTPPSPLELKVDPLGLVFNLVYRIIPFSCYNYHNVTTWQVLKYT